MPDPIQAIEKYLNANNSNPKPFIWTQSADAILEKVKRCQVVLN